MALDKSLIYKGVVLPDHKGRLTEQEKKYVSIVAETGNARLAAKEAGYKAPHVSAYQKLNNPTILAEVSRLQTEKLVTELAPIALATLQDVMTSKTAPAAARVQAAKVVLDKGGVGVRTADGEGKEPHEMSGDELANAIMKLTAVVEERRRTTIDVTPTPVAEGSIFD